MTAAGGPPAQDDSRAGPAPEARKSGAAGEAHAAQETPATPEARAPVPMHPALVPTGEAIAWSALGSLLAGPVVWGGVGLLADHVLGTGRLFLAIGLVGGAVTGMWIVYLRFGQDDTGKPGRDGR